MKLKWHGHSCFELTLNNGKVIITDPFDGTVGYPLCRARADLILSSHDHFDHNHFASIAGNPQIIRTAGMHEACGARITGVHSWHDPEAGALRGENIIFRIEADGLRIVHLGDLGHMPETDAQKDILANVDLLLIPIGGVFTITTPQAVELIETYRPHAAIAMHFKNHLCGFNIADASDFVRLTGAQTLPNEIELAPGSLEGCGIMEI